LVSAFGPWRTNQSRSQTPLQQKDMMLALTLGRTLGSPVPLAAANEMMNACRGLGIDDNGFVVAHRVYQRLGGQS
jgi:3-hydroxyisobutyrate dehydrogenase-like beta-hydroxyacid dehydrogenase